jgi:hypothetical protein
MGSISSSITAVPLWYALCVGAVALFHVVRGAVGQTYLNPARSLLKETWMRVIVLYIPDALLHLLSTFVGGLALWFSYIFATRAGEEVKVGTVVAILSLAVFGLAGITGVVATILSTGKIPSLK